MDNEVLNIIASRRSHRVYQPGQISRQQLDHLISAALSSPSANNHQPWHFTVVQNQDLLSQIAQATREAAMELELHLRSPRFVDEDFHVFYHAPTVIFLSADAQQHKQLDCGIAVYGLALAAQSLGLGSVILGLPRLAFEGKQRAMLESALGFPPGHSFVIAIALGTPTDRKDPPQRDHGKVHYIV